MLGWICGLVLVFSFWLLLSGEILFIRWELVALSLLFFHVALSFHKVGVLQFVVQSQCS